LRSKQKYLKLYQDYQGTNLRALEISRVVEIYHQFKGFETCGDNILITQIASIFYNIIKQRPEHKEVLEGLIEIVLPIRIENKEYNWVGAIYKDLSYIKRLQGDYETPFEYIFNSLENYTKFGEPIRIAVALNSIGNFYLDTGELNHALEYYHKAYENIKLFSENDNYFIIKSNLANIYLTLNYFNKAKQLYIEDLDRLKENNLHDRYAKALLGISLIYKEENRTKLAFKYARLSVKSFEKSTDNVGYANATSTLGSIYGDFEKYEEALAHYKKAKEILEKIQYKLELLKLHNLMGETYLQMGDTIMAIQNLELAKSIALDIKQNLELRKIYDNLYQAYDKANKTKLAYQALKDYTELNKKIYGTTIQARVNEIQSAHAIEQRELEFKKELEVSSYKLRSLQHQMNPHFIFNSMGTIQNLVLEGHDAATLNFISDFSQLMRTMLEHSRHDTISLEEEIHFLKKYCDLECVRYHHEFDIFFQIELDSDELDDIFLPTMMLQPFIENAIKHGVSNLRRKRGEIHIIFNYLEDGHFLEVTIRDNGRGLSPNAARSNHTSKALSIIEERLQLYQIQQHFGSYTIHYSKKGTEAKIKIPI
jgi:sensor histidine kinase YesM